MEIDKKIVEFQNGDTVQGFYLLKDASVRTSAKGDPFLSAVLTDNSGSIEAKMWDYSGDIGASDAGTAVKIRGQVSEYKGQLQLKLVGIRRPDATDSYNLADMVPTAPIDREAALRDVRRLLASMEDADYRRVAETMLDRHLDAFCRIPAAKSVHHGFIGGLLMHTWRMLLTADFLSGLYREVVDRSLLLTGTLLHDFGKEREFAVTGIGLVSDYSTPGKLLGHLVMGAQEIAALCRDLAVPEEKSLLLQHLILSHHGEPEFGAAVVPQCAEAELLSYIDKIDSRMEIYGEVFDKLQPGTFSERIPWLEKKIYRHF